MAHPHWSGMIPSPSDDQLNNVAAYGMASHQPKWSYLFSDGWLLPFFSTVCQVPPFRDSQSKEENKMANKILNTHKYCDQKSYNGQPLRPGEVLVPFWCTKDMQLDNDTCIHDNFTTWKKGGYHFLIGFAPIQESAYEEYMKDFNRQINSFLDTWRLKSFMYSS